MWLKIERPPITSRGYECFPVVLTPSSDTKIFTPERTQMRER